MSVSVLLPRTSERMQVNESWPLRHRRTILANRRPLERPQERLLERPHPRVRRRAPTPPSQARRDNPHVPRNRGKDRAKTSPSPLSLVRPLRVPRNRARVLPNQLANPLPNRLPVNRPSLLPDSRRNLASQPSPANQTPRSPKARNPAASPAVAARLVRFLSTWATSTRTNSGNCSTRPKTRACGPARQPCKKG